MRGGSQRAEVLVDVGEGTAVLGGGMVRLGSH